MAQKTGRSIRLFGLLVAQLCAYSMLSALCFACPLYLFDCSGSSTLYGAVAAIAFIPGVLATPAGGILADRGRRRGVLVVLGIVLMATSPLFILVKRSLPLAVVVAAMLCVQYGIQSLLKPMLQIETVRMTGQEKVERATALVSQITMMSNILGPVVGTAVYGCFGIDTLCATASVTFAISALLFGGALKQNASSETMGDCATRTTCRNDFRESIRYLLQNSSLVAVILLAAVLNLALVGLTIGAPIIVAKHLGMQSSCVGIVEVALGLGGLTGSGLVGIWPHRFSLNGICRYVAMICFGVVPIIVTLLSGPDELAFAALAAGSAWVMAWASITSVEIVSFVQRSAPKKLCGKVLALVYMTLSCATPIGQLIYGLAYDRWTPAIVFAGMLAVLTLTTALFYRLKSRLWRLS
ncbi:MFS transporter [Collinsella aerofaciens]|uniref:MFS transporter n=1 Tax=Collinsella aerofaciens TaxID=74426 RepID=UPI0021B36258|nr:MFS transporter [Collinsella aerofaciens]MCT6783396.1 MFS transporter [Collinsella aerofaciens]